MTLPPIVYPWKRFWHPRGSEISLADSGFLVDPECEYGSYYSKDVRPFDAIGHSPCMVLLGEPGIGKSTALKAEFGATRIAAESVGDSALLFDLRDYSSDERLERKVFKCDAMQTWLASERTLHLFLDSLDEGLLRIDNISRVILSELRELPLTRLRFRIASRPADWQSSLEEGFRQLWGDHNVGVFSLAPLLKKDAICAARMTGVDAEAFITTVIQAEAAPLAIKPVTLDLLIAAFAKNGTLPARRTELYLEGCRRLCEEPSPSRTDSLKARPRLGTGQRMAIAGRLAAISQFSNRSAFWTGPQAGIEPQDIPLEMAIGGTEGFNETEVTVDLNSVRDVLDTGLFSSPAQNRQSWHHQTYAEYLAAFYLNSNKVALEKLRTLFLHPDAPNKVIPQLREIAAWLASLNPDFFRMIARVDAEILLQSDMAAMSPADRADLTRKLLQSFDQGGILESIWNFHRSFAGLNNPELPAIVRPYLSGKTYANDSRIAAIEIIAACKLRGLEQELLAIVSDGTDHESVRERAIEAFNSIGLQVPKSALQALAFGQSGEDPDDDLKGYAFKALWPDYLTAKDLFDHLPAPQKTNYFGPYRRFLDSGIPESLQAADMPVALVWARQYSAVRDESNVLTKLATEVLNRAIDHIGETGVADLLAAAVIERYLNFSDSEQIAKKLRDSGEKSRYMLAVALLHQANSLSQGAFIVTDVCSIGAEDVPWLLRELDNRDEDVQQLVAEVIARRLDKVNVSTFGAVLSVALSNKQLGKAIAPLITPIDLDSTLAARQKEEHALWSTGQSPRPTPPSIPADKALSTILARRESTVYFEIHCALFERRKNHEHSSDPLPEWSKLSPGIQSRILTSAREYLRTRPPAPKGCWWKTGTFSFGMVAGSSAMNLLAVESPASIDALSGEDWDFWMPLIVSYAPDHSAGRDLVIEKAYGQAKDRFIAILSDVIDGENARFGRVRTRDHIGSLWSEELAATIRAQVAALKPDAFRDVVAVLLTKGDLQTEELARQMATGPKLAEGDDRRRCVFAVTELLAHNPQEWKSLWPIFQSDILFGVEVLEVVAYELQYKSFATEISANEVAELCIWLAGMGLEKQQADPQDLGFLTSSGALAQWWNILVNSVANRGTADACAALQQMIVALPQYKDGLRHALQTALELMRRATWHAPSPSDILEIAKYDREPKLVISVHGIRTRGAWQKEVNSNLQRAGFRHELLDYGHFGALQLLIPWMRSKKVDWFRDEYERCVAGFNARPSIIAHSFGTYIVTGALLKYQNIAFDRLILCGSIVRRDYPWDRLLSSNQGNAVLNEYGGRDPWVKIAHWLLSDAGASGATGFETADPAVYQRQRPYFGHSDYFFPLNYENNWIPFLRGIEPGAETFKQTSRPNWRFALVFGLGILVLARTLFLLVVLFKNRG